MNNGTLEEKFNTLVKAFSTLAAENQQLKDRLNNLEKLSGIKSLINEQPQVSYLADRLIHPYHKNAAPYFLVSAWTAIFSYLSLDPYERWALRKQCKLFRDTLAPPLVATFPTGTIRKLSTLLSILRKRTKRNKTCPTLVLLGQGDHTVTVKEIKNRSRNYQLIMLPITFVGHSKETTRIIGGLEVKGDPSSAVPFRCVDLTITGSLGSGVWNTGCLPMEFLRCNICRNGVMGIDTYKLSKWKLSSCNIVDNASTGIGAKGASGELINCTVSGNGNSGIRAQEDTEIHLYGDRTHVWNNCCRKQKENSFGLYCTDNSRIVLHEPLGLNCVHGNGKRSTKGHSKDMKGAVLIVP